MSDINPEEEIQPDEVTPTDSEQTFTPEEGDTAPVTGEMPQVEDLPNEEIRFDSTQEASFRPVDEPYLNSSPIDQKLPLTNSEERTWAAIAHLSVLANLITGFLGPVIALIIYLVFRDKSRYVAHQAFQAFLFQLIFWIGGGFIIGATWTLVGILSIILVGLCLIPLACVISLLPVYALGYGIAGAIKSGQGEDFRYWLIGNWTEDLLK
jgi:uncharacterized protein